MSQETNSQPLAHEAESPAMNPVLQETLDKLEGVLVQLQRLIENRSRESLQQPGQDGRWGVVEVLCYLRDWEDILHDRVWQIVEGERPEFEDPDMMMWSLEHEYGAQDPHEVFEALLERRLSLIGRLRETDEAAWERTGVLSGRGEVSLAELLHHVIEHDQRFLVEAREAVA
jgi:hypothetical protein